MLCESSRMRVIKTVERHNTAQHIVVLCSNISNRNCKHISHLKQQKKKENRTKMKGETERKAKNHSGNFLITFFQNFHSSM